MKVTKTMAQIAGWVGRGGGRGGEGGNSCLSFHLLLMFSFFLGALQRPSESNYKSETGARGKLSNEWLYISYCTFKAF